MALRLVIGACSNEHVASWALQSMGDEFATQTRREAARKTNPLDGTVTLPCEERERSRPYGFSSRRDGLAPRGHRRGAEDAV